MVTVVQETDASIFKEQVAARGRMVLVAQKRRAERWPVERTIESPAWIKRAALRRSHCECVGIAASRTVEPKLQWQRLAVLVDLWLGLRRDRNRPHGHVKFLWREGRRLLRRLRPYGM